MAEWSFLTNHARVLVCIAHDPGVRLRDIAPTWTSPNAAPTASSTTSRQAATSSRPRTAAATAPDPVSPAAREAITQQRTIGEVLDVLVESKNCSSSA